MSRSWRPIMRYIDAAGSTVLALLSLVLVAGVFTL